ncbi:MAG: alpha/beta hydrolase [Desulfuromonadaceae bacterium]|nr:alpha/beta hydrolase [Desulfuromonadaceae bacterium]
METKYLQVPGPHGSHRLAYHEWGKADADHVVVCVHGLTRSGRDFDPLAQMLADRCRVVCPDLPGRGESEWLSHPHDYGYPLYLADIVTLLDHIGAQLVDWVGTSLGGLLGMMLAVQPGSPIRRLVLNDIGPFIPKAALERIAAYVGNAPAFQNIASLERHLRIIHAAFGPLTDDHWSHLARCSSRQLPDGTFALHYDPAIGTALRTNPAQDVDLWSMWDSIRCPVLVLRGTASDILLAETATEMTRRGPRAQLVQIPDTGHAPPLMAPEQVELIRSWLHE